MIDISRFYSSPAYATGETTEKQRPQAASAGVFRNSLIHQTSEMNENELPTGAIQRSKLSDAEIAALRNRYDVRNMSDEQYDAFLDDLADMGAISRREKELLDDNGSFAEDPDGDGERSRDLVIKSAWCWLGSPTPAFRREETSGDILKWVTDRLKWKPAGKTAAQQKAQAEEIDLFENLSAILSRMTGTQPVTAQKGGMEEDEEPGIIDQLRDPGSALYQDLFQRMRIQLEESQEEKKKQAVIDALGAILDGMRSTDGVAAKRKDMVSSMAELSRQISRLDENDPRRTQLDLFRQRLNRMGIYMDLDAGGKGGKHSIRTGETLTRFLIREEEQTFHFDNI